MSIEGVVALQPGNPLSEAVRAVMRANRRRDTAPEVRVRRALFARGHRYRVDYPVQAGIRRVRVDVAFPRQRLAIFIDGCFWHRCSQHGTSPRHNSGYWAAKLERNVARDMTVTAELTQAGWKVVRIWEHDSAIEAVNAIEAALAGDSL